MFINIIASPVCLNTYGHPSKLVFFVCFLIFYTLNCTTKKLQEKNSIEKYDKIINYAKIGACFLILLVVFLIYISG